MIKRDDVYRIGTIGKSHGVKGEVSFRFDDDVFDSVDADYLVLDIDGILVPFFIEEYRFRGNETAIVKFEDVDSQDGARALTGSEVFFPRSLADSSQTGEMSLPELVGYTVVDASDGNDIGTLCGIDDTTVNMLFVISASDGREILVPVNPDWIDEVDSGRRRIVMMMPPGLLEL